VGLYEAVALLGAAAAVEDVRCSDRGRARKWQDGALRRAGLAFERRFREASAVLESPATGSALLPSQERGFPVARSIRAVPGRAVAAGQFGRSSSSIIVDTNLPDYIRNNCGHGTIRGDHDNDYDYDNDGRDDDNEYDDRCRWRAASHFQGSDRGGLRRKAED